MARIDQNNWILCFAGAIPRCGWSSNRPCWLLDKTLEDTMNRQDKYRKRHPDRVRESQRRWREENREYLREYNKEYKKRNQKDYRERRKFVLWQSIVGIWGDGEQPANQEEGA
jgi:hypothetical protein